MDAETLQREYGMFSAQGGEETPELEFGDIPRMPHFPIVIFSFAVLKDGILDPAFFGLTLIVPPAGYILGFFSNIIFGLTIFFWFLGKPKIQKAEMPWLVKRIALAVLVSTIPGASFIIPENTILVILTHNKEKENVKLFLQRFEKIEGTP